MSVVIDSPASRNVLCSAIPTRSKLHAQVFQFAKAVSEHLIPQTSAYHEIWLDKKMVAGDAVKDVEPLYGELYLPRKVYYLHTIRSLILRHTHSSKSPSPSPLRMTSTSLPTMLVLLQLWMRKATSPDSTSLLEEGWVLPMETRRRIPEQPTYSVSVQWSRVKTWRRRSCWSSETTVTAQSTFSIATVCRTLFADISKAAKMPG